MLLTSVRLTLQLLRVVHSTLLQKRVTLAVLKTDCSRARVEAGRSYKARATGSFNRMIAREVVRTGYILKIWQDSQQNLHVQCTCVSNITLQADSQPGIFLLRITALTSSSLKINPSFHICVYPFTLSRVLCKSVEVHVDVWNRLWFQFWHKITDDKLVNYCKALSLLLF